MQEDTYTGNPNDPLSLNLYVYCANNPLMYTDPTGHFWHIVGGALIGAGISAIIDVGSQMLIERKSFKSINWKSVGVSALEGAVSGGLAAATGGASLAASAGKGVAKATGKQIIKKAVKTAVVEGVAGAAINAGAQKVVKGEVDWSEVAVSGASDAISGGLGSALPNTKLGQKLMDAGKSAKEKVGNVISSIGDSVKKQADTVKKQIDNAFSPKLATAGGIDIGVDDFDNSLKNIELPKTEVQKNYNAIMNETKSKPSVDVNAGVGKGNKYVKEIRRVEIDGKEIVTGPYRQMQNAGLKDAHHVYQDAAVRELTGYSKHDALTVQIKGPANQIGTPHYNATQAQGILDGGTLSAERSIAYKALRKAGFTKNQAKHLIKEADKYFDDLGHTLNAATRMPGNRR